MCFMHTGGGSIIQQLQQIQAASMNETMQVAACEMFKAVSPLPLDQRI